MLTESDRKYIVQTLSTMVTHAQRPSLHECGVVAQSLVGKYRFLKGEDEDGEVGTGKHRHEYGLQRVSTVRIHTMRTPPTCCASPFKYRANPCKVRSDTMYLHGLHYGYTRTCEQCPHSMNTDSVDPIEVRIRGCFSL